MVRRRREDAQELGRRVRVLRLAAGVTQEALGQMVGVDRTEIGHVERGEKDLRFSTILRVAQGLGVDVGDLVRGIKLDGVRG
jgi:transcriptional regulator with XRE-family HTH domain